MTKTSLKVRLRINKYKYNILKTLCLHSKNLYNQANYLIQQYYKYTGKYLTYYDMYYIMRNRENLEHEINFKKLKSGVSQQVLMILDTNWKAYFRSVNDWKKNKSKYNGLPKPPGYIKEYNNLVYTYVVFQNKNKYIQLEKKLGINIDIPKQLINKNIKQIEIISRRECFEAVFVYDDAVKYKQIEKNDNVLGIDLGLNNIATCVSNNIKPFVINGKPLKSINQYSNKKIAKTKSCLEHRNTVKTSKKIIQLYYKRNNKISDYLHKASRLIVNKCVENNISKVIVGDISKSLTKINLGKRNNQNFINISLGQFVDKIKYKLEKHNIKTIITNESYTSKCSFIDNDTLPQKLDTSKKFVFSGKRIKRGMYRTKNNILINADVNGAYNIIRKVIPKFDINLLKDGIEGDTMCRWLHPHKLTV